MFFAFFQLEQKLLDAFLFVDIEKMLLQPWTLVFDGLAVDAAKQQLQEFPHAVRYCPNTGQVKCLKASKC